MDVESQLAADLAIVNKAVERLESRMALCDDSELPAVGGLLLKYLERRAAMLGLDAKAAPGATGSIAEVTKRLGLVARR